MSGAFQFLFSETRGWRPSIIGMAFEILWSDDVRMLEVSFSEDGVFFALCSLCKDKAPLLDGFIVGRRRARVSHLQFAYDTIFFSISCSEELQTLKIILLMFGQISGLKSTLTRVSSLASTLIRFSSLDWHCYLIVRLLTSLFPIWISHWT